MNIIEKKTLLHKMQERLTVLENRQERDFSGGVQPDVFAIRELKYWIGVIERGEVDAKVWED